MIKSVKNESNSKNPKGFININALFIGLVFALSSLSGINHDPSITKTYKNEYYGFTVELPENWRVAKSIMAWQKNDSEASGSSWESNEDWVMLTNMSPKEEGDYLRALEGYQGLGGGMEHVEMADGRTIIITATSSTIQEVKALSEDPEDVFSKTSGFEEIQNGSGIPITLFDQHIVWEMNRDNKVALIPYHGIQLDQGEGVKNMSITIEKNEGNYDEAAFEKIVSSFRFTTKSTQEK